MYTGIELLVRVILAHCVADYLLQPKEMAVRKSERSMAGKGFAQIHCILYATVMVLFVGHLDGLLFCWIYLSHFVIDRYSLTKYWLKLIKGRDILTESNEGSHIEQIFACIVYVISDATLHFILLGVLFKWIK